MRSSTPIYPEFEILTFREILKKKSSNIVLHLHTCHRVKYDGRFFLKRTRYLRTIKSFTQENIYKAIAELNEEAYYMQHEEVKDIKEKDKLDNKLFILDSNQNE